jgi:L-seryl-tRNA(Ser) seleniumtransferase
MRNQWRRTKQHVRFGISSQEDSSNMSNPLFRGLPSVSRLLDHPLILAVRASYAPDAITMAVRIELDSVRSELRSDNGEGALPSEDDLVQRVVTRLAQAHTPRLRRVLNATGIVLHTNLGRSPMAESAARAAYEAARGYLNLEMDLESGLRSSRQNPTREGICALTGAESATAVNNCAAATVIVLRALAMNKEVIVSRGQLIEIGGSFRIPEILEVSGASLREVGTTNITRVSDYERAIGPNTGMIMRIHTSNYRIRGFTQSASLEELVELGRKYQIPVVDDAGSGAVMDLAPFGMPGEPDVTKSLPMGADLVLFSGDKLLGGPQAGIIAGKAEWIARIEKDPLMRAFRLDKMTLAALESTLLFHRDPNRALREVPSLRMLTTPASVLADRCQAFAQRLRSIAGLTVAVRPDEAFVGGGSLPDVALPTTVVAMQADSIHDAEFSTRLRLGTPAVVSRVQGGAVLLDLRTIFPEEEDALFEAIAEALRVALHT